MAKSADSTCFGKLGHRELRIAKLAALGYSNREIAADLETNEQIVKNVLHSVFDKLGVWNRVELAARFSGDPERLETSLQRIETERLEELRRCHILDSASEEVFDRLTRLAVAIFDVPICLVALVDSDRVWFKSNIGLEVSEVPRKLAICRLTVRQSRVLVVTDAAQDSRFACNPMIRDFGVRFYAATPILTGDGYALGVVCIVDRIPRLFTTAQLSVLESIASLALQQIELRRKLAEKPSLGAGQHEAGSEPMAA